MPELPEVETVVRDLRKKVIGRTITAVWTDWPKLIKDYEAQSRLHVSEKAVAHFKKHIVGKKIERVERRAKNILIYLSASARRSGAQEADHLMLVHLKMTGHFLVGRWRTKSGKAVGVSPAEIVNDSYNHHVHLIFDLSPRHSDPPVGGEESIPENRSFGVPQDDKHLKNNNDTVQLGLSDVRKFAKVLFGTREQIESLPELIQLGPDALDQKLTIQQFKRIVKFKERLGAAKPTRSEGRPIKQVLMDPATIAGIGNIYSDDILWRAQVHPKRPSNSLTSAELGSIYRAMRTVLKTAVKLRGTSTSDFRDTDGKEGGYTEHRLVYRRTGEPCGRCKSPIKRMVVGGRSAHYCPACQQLR